jgi:hypothetical protein
LVSIISGEFLYQLSDYFLEGYRLDLCGSEKGQEQGFRECGDEPLVSIISGEFLYQLSDYFLEEFCKKVSVTVKVEEQCHQERKPKKS